MAIITDPDNLNQGTEVTIATGARTIDLHEAGNLSSDGVTLQALYSFLKEEWKSDATLIPHPFPLVAITPEQFEFIENWNPFDDAARKLQRTAGWREIDDDGVLLKEFAGIKTLGTFEDDANDNAYYQQGDDPTDTGAPVDFTYAGPVNEAIESYNLITPPDTSTGFDFVDGGAGNDQISRNDGGSWLTDGYSVGGQVTVLDAETPANDGTFTILAVTATDLDVGTGLLTADTGDQAVQFARNHRNALKLFLRVRDGDTNGKTFAQADLPSIGEAALFNKLFSFPLSNATDLKISETDANIGSTSPYTSIEVRYFDQAFSRDVDTTTARDFGIVINAAGSHSGVDGSSAATAVFTSAEGGMTIDEFAGGTLTIHEGTDAGDHTVVSNTATTITVSVALTASESNLSFTAHLSSPVTADAEEIYEKVQYLLRQESDIDVTGDVVTGATADELLRFVGDTLEAGAGTPTNPNGGGTGVIIEGFDSNDTNRLVFYDNTGTDRTYPFVAAGTINFNSNLVDDTGPAEYWMFFEYTTRTNVADLVITGTADTITSAGSNLPVLSSGDYVTISGLTGADEAMNGVYLLSGTPTAASWDVSRYDGQTIVTTTSAAADVDENPIDSPDAIVVDNNAGADIAGTIGASSAAFDFDYDGNTQGGRTQATNAEIVLRAIGHDTAQFVETTGTITRATGLSFSLVAALERNYDNP